MSQVICYSDDRLTNVMPGVEGVSAAAARAVEWRQSHLGSIFSPRNGGDNEAAVWQVTM